MRVKRILPLLLTVCLSFTLVQSTFDRSAYYAAFTGQDLKQVESELSELEKITGKDAFKGALLMKKAGMMTGAKDKLMLFKKGHKDLELSIFKDSTNAEYRFLRLVIQENAPKIVNYNKELKKDAAYIRKSYKTLEPGLQKTILNYSKTSKELKPEDLKSAAHG